MKDWKVGMYKTLKRKVKSGTKMYSTIHTSLTDILLIGKMKIALRYSEIKKQFVFA